MQRLDTKGHSPIVEYRKEHQMFFVVYESLGVELAPAFGNKWTAHEIALNGYYGVPFFTMIPTVPIDTPYPRPNLLMPDIKPVYIQLRLR